jgi:ATP-dependent exoDNAse (exonuclease V) beta subunit
VLANTDVFLEMSRAYDVRGLRAFARDMRANWEEAVRQVEGRPDAEEQSIALITIHAAKGLEWPIVIPINMTGAPKAESGLMHDRRSDRFSIPVFGVEPTEYGDIKAWNVEELGRERVRLWYVAATRARDLLILPRHSSALNERAYAKIVDLDLPSIEPIDPEALGDPMPALLAPQKNQQTRTLFAEEAGDISRSHRKIAWRQPSRSEAVAPAVVERKPIFGGPESVEETFEQPAIVVVGGATRGTILHKLMEEVLNGETEDGLKALVARALELMAQLSITPCDQASDGISPHELARTITRTLSIPEIAKLRPRLVPELAICGSQMNDDGEIIVSGIADAVAYDTEGRIEIIVDWKSDVDIDIDRLNFYRGQLDTYRRHTGAPHSFLVLMTPGTVIAA